MKTLPRKFNPGLNQSDQDLIAQYVVRRPILDRVLGVIAGNTHRDICQHHLYYGPRGRGKTMLMARIAAELRVNTKFSEHWIPIRLIEEGYYEISTIAEFWLEVMSELTLNLTGDFQQNAQLTLQHLKTHWSHPNLQQMAQAAVLEQLSNINKRAVIIVENLHQLMDEAGDELGWQIRRVMQNEPRIMFLATATTHFDDLDNAEKPFFEIFATIELPPLDRTETADLWNALTNSNKSEQEVAPLAILTGGSPRLLNIIAQFDKHHNIRALMENLAGIIDEYTEYFKSQLDALAPQERRVFLALADLWAESTAKEVAERARMDIRPTSALLGRLESKGALTVNAQNPKRKTYLVGERLFCIYYKLRREHSQDTVVKSLVQFMVDFYTPEQINHLLASYQDKEQLEPYEAEVLKRLTDISTIKTATSSSSNEADLMLMLEGADDFYLQDKFSQAIEGYAQVIERFQSSTETALLEQVAMAMFNQAISYGQIGDTMKALQGYAQVIERFQNSPETALLQLVAIAILNQATTYRQIGDTTKALQGYAQAIERFQNIPGTASLMAIAAIGQANTYEQIGDTTKALQGYAQVIERFQNSQETALLEQVAKAMVNQAAIYEKIGDTTKALQGYAQVIERFQNSKKTVLFKVAVAMVNQAHLLAATQQWPQATEKYQHTLSYLKDKTIPDQSICMATASLGGLISQHAPALKKPLQAGLAKVVAKATHQSPTEERMTLALGIGAFFPPATALAIIQQSYRSEELQPLIIALQLEKGDTVRTSEEMREVAADVRKRMAQMREEFSEAKTERSW